MFIPTLTSILVNADHDSAVRVFQAMHQVLVVFLQYPDANQAKLLVDANLTIRAEGHWKQNDNWCTEISIRLQGATFAEVRRLRLIHQLNPVSKKFFLSLRVEETTPNELFCDIFRQPEAIPA